MAPDLPPFAFWHPVPHFFGVPWWFSDKESACKVGDTGDVGLIPGLGRSLGEGHGNPLQYSCLENLMDRGAWRATVHGIAKSWIQLSDLACAHACTHPSSLLVDTRQLNWPLNVVAHGCPRPSLSSSRSPACISHPTLSSQQKPDLRPSPSPCPRPHWPELPPRPSAWGDVLPGVTSSRAHLGLH